MQHMVSPLGARNEGGGPTYLVILAEGGLEAVKDIDHDIFDIGASRIEHQETPVLSCRHEAQVPS